MVHAGWPPGSGTTEHSRETSPGPYREADSEFGLPAARDVESALDERAGSLAWRNHLPP